MLAIVDSGLANLASVQNALARLGAEAVITQDPAVIAAADRVILPGVGAAQTAMQGLATRGLISVLKGLTQPVLGICLGMQMMFASSTEGEGATCLGIFDGAVTRLPDGKDGPIPHMGWNTLSFDKPDHPLLRNVAAGAYVYFVHSYAAPVSSITVAQAAYNAPFSAMVASRNFIGCQFHPEKSGAVGAAILRNFLEL